MKENGIVFTKHAREKFAVLKKHKFLVSEKQVLTALKKPDFIDYSRVPLLIAQKNIDKSHVLRVVFKRSNEGIKIITFYPGRRKIYEKETSQK